MYLFATHSHNLHYTLGSYFSETLNTQNQQEHVSYSQQQNSLPYNSRRIENYTQNHSKTVTTSHYSLFSNSVINATSSRQSYTSQNNPQQPMFNVHHKKSFPNRFPVQTVVPSTYPFSVTIASHQYNKELVKFHEALKTIRAK